MSLGMHVLNTANIRDISPDVVAPDGRPRILPAEFYRSTTAEERAIVGARNAFYCLPTQELVDWVKAAIGDRTAIEIGAGNGAMAQALGIQATDSGMQSDPLIAAHYAMSGQKVIDYGQNVEILDASQAIKKYKPQVVVATWVTHMYREDRHEAGGNMFGVVEEEIVDQCEAYIFIGNTTVHKHKSIWTLPHTRFEPDWLYSRALNGSPEFIAVWGK